MKLNKNEKNYLLITLFKSYIFQSAICSVIIVICTAVLHTGLTWILDRYVEHYYLIYRGLYVYMTALIIWVICMMFVGCSNSTSAPASEARGFTDFEHIEKEYLATIEKLNWPDGVTLPDKLEGEDTGTSFQVGYGDTRASNLWEYSWMKEWLNSYSTDSARAEKALEELEKAFDMPYMGTDRCDDATRNYLRENIDKAKLGDPSGFRECIELNYE